ncbi:hypothetical protein GCK32_006513 [Trichostrongylus colubriformis]|uniref:Uncharacterized protein n=1 Tax=Trichostrongylus colubriformis TaxID=6319 RepID=A0AAN8IAC1_TRICO
MVHHTAKDTWLKAKGTYPGCENEYKCKLNSKEECRRKDQEISRLEKKLEDKDVVMNDCLRELKEQHKTRVTELEERVADMKKKIAKLESENNVQKMKLETSIERESSVDSDYGRSSSGRLSNTGRQYSLMSLNSFTSIRTLNNRRMTDSDMSSSLYSTHSSRRRGDYDTPCCPLTRAPSTSSILEKDRRISDLERQLNQHENALRNARRGENDAERERLRDELAHVQVELDRAVATIRQLEGNVQSQEALGGTLEAQYRNALMELETTRDENCALKAKIRRQYKQIELLTQQDETNSALNTFENKLERMDMKEH